MCATDEALISATYNYRAVTPDLTSSGQPSSEQLAALARSGCQVIINLALHDDPRYSLTDETGLVHSLGMEYVHIPVDFEEPGAADLERFFNAMDTHADKRLHVHCAANWRVSAFLGLYFRIRRHQPENQAFALMREVWIPNARWQQFIAAMLKRAGL